MIYETRHKHEDRLRRLERNILRSGDSRRKPGPEMPVSVVPYRMDNLAAFLRLIRVTAILQQREKMNHK